MVSPVEIEGKVTQRTPPRTRRPTKGRIPIQNPELLARLLDAAWRKQWTSIRAACRELRISQPLLSRLIRPARGVRPTIRAISYENYRSLFRLFPERQHPAVKRAFILGPVARLRDGHANWVWHQVQKSSNGIETRWYWTERGPKHEKRRPVRMGTSDRDRERLLLWRKLRSLSPGLYKSAEALLRTTPVDGYREMALCRVLDPLISSDDSAFIEPSWREWCRTATGRECLLRFVRLGVRRERMLLKGRPRVTELL